MRRSRDDPPLNLNVHLPTSVLAVQPLTDLDIGVLPLQNFTSREVRPRRPTTSIEVTHNR